jgi:hypothetical protein
MRGLYTLTSKHAVIPVDIFSKVKRKAKLNTTDRKSSPMHLEVNYSG